MALKPLVTNEFINQLEEIGLPDVRERLTLAIKNRLQSVKILKDNFDADQSACNKLLKNLNLT